MATNPTAPRFTHTSMTRTTLSVTAQLHVQKVFSQKSVFNNPRLLLFYHEESLQSNGGRDAFVIMPLQTTRLLVRKFLTGAQTVTGSAAGS